MKSPKYFVRISPSGSIFSAIGVNSVKVDPDTKTVTIAYAGGSIVSLVADTPNAFVDELLEKAEAYLDAQFPGAN